MSTEASLTLIAVVVALIIGVASLVQTKRIQKGERKQRLLNEIMDWANDVLMCGSEMHVQPVPGITREAHRLHAASALYLRYKVVNARTKYVEKIASEFGQALLPTLASVISKLKNLANLLEQNVTVLMRGDALNKELMEKTSTCDLELYDLLKGLIERIGEVKAGDKRNKIKEEGKQMTESEILEKLGKIEKNQGKSERQSSIAFGITIAVIGWNFLQSALVTKEIGLIVASTILIALGFSVMFWGVAGLRKSRKLSKAKP